MDRIFDDLFNEFFKRNKINPEDRISDSLKDEAQKMIKMLQNFNELENIDEAVEREMDETLGKPDKIEFYNEGNMFFEKRIWYTPTGDVVKLIATDDPDLLTPQIKLSPVKQISEKSLTELMNEAIANEDYEKAASIRDEIKRGQAPKKIRKKTK
jgi:excinuclease UvrABC helicase subunit UvrB